MTVGQDLEPRIVAVGSPPTFRQQVARTLRLDQERVEWVPSVTSAEDFLASGSAAALMVLSPDVKEADAIGLAEFTTRHAPATAVVLVRDHPANGLLPVAMRAGIRDVVDQSKGSEELRDALERALSWSASLRQVSGDRGPHDAEQGKVVSIFSSKGGAGKTFLASNLAVALAERTRFDVALVDLELEMGDVFSYFGREPSRTLQDLVALGTLSDPEQVKSIGTQLGQHLWGFAAPHEPGAEPVSGEAVGKTLRALRGAFSFALVDASANYSDHALAAFDLSDSIYLIASLDVVGIRHLSMALNTLLQLGLPRERFRVVLNRADSKVGLDAAEVERITRIKVDAMIPSSRLVPTALNKGVPVYLDEPRSPVAQAIGELAEKVIFELAPPEESAAPRQRRLFGRR